MVAGSQVIFTPGNAEIVEKKSRFIGDLYPAKDEAEAEEMLEQVRKRHYNANHHCYAMAVGERGEFMRSSDDGEPSGTAGKPILHVLVSSGIVGGILIVTRYFGGTLLGTGGLTRAYSQAASAAVQAATLIRALAGEQFTIVLDYSSFGKLQYQAAKAEVTVEEVTYRDQVTVRLLSPAEKAEDFLKKMTEMTGGTARIIDRKSVLYGLVDGNVILL